jgi:hypothetical protein
MELTLQDSEVNYLLRLLQQNLSELKMEISNTESYDMRQQLKQDEVVLKSILRRLDPAIAL